MSMNRRDWLTGVVTSVVGAQMVIAAQTAQPLGSLVVPDQEVKIFAPGEERAIALGSLLGTLYTKQGKEYIPVARVRRMEHNTGVDRAGKWNDPLDVTDLPKKTYARGEVEFFPEIFERIRLDIGGEKVKW
jgi:hypothetical protein